MRGGGITRLNYQEGGMGMVEDQMMQPQQPMQPPLQGMEQPQTDIKDPKQALEIIIQMLIAQGIPPEQAKQIALQMVQAVAEGGMKEMSNERITARFGGSMRNGREHYGLGSIFKGVTKAVSGVVSGVTNAVKSVVSSPIGKLALTAAAMYYAPLAFRTQSAGAAGYAQAFPGLSNTFLGTAGADLIAGGEGISTAGLFGVGGNFAPLSGTLASSLMSPSGIIKSLGGNALGSLAGGFLGGTLAGAPQQQPGESTADYQVRVDKYKAQYAPLLNPTTTKYPNNPFYPQMAANGGRIGYQEGGIGNLVKQTTQQAFLEHL
jgi:hypothetical protein